MSREIGRVQEMSSEEAGMTSDDLKTISALFRQDGITSEDIAAASDILKRAHSDRLRQEAADKHAERLQAAAVAGTSSRLAQTPPAESSSAPASERLNINLTKGAADTLDYLVSVTGKSKTEIVRDALFLERYAQDAWREGGKVIVQRGREKREVIPH
jgi:hypothetical protein